MTPLITTGRLELRPFRDQDAAELHEIFSDPETSRVWATIRPHNIASLRVAAKIGMTPRHTTPDSRGPLIYLARPLQAK